MFNAVELLLASELFKYHYERMIGLVMVEAQEVSVPSVLLAPKADKQNTNPHELYIIYHIILYYGFRHASLFRSHRKWHKLLPTLGEVVSVEAEEVCPNPILPVGGDQASCTDV